MPIIQTTSHKIFYSHNRVKSNLHLLFVHGAGGSHLLWPGELRRLKTISCYAIDLPGHHKSPRPSCHTIAQYATAVSEFVEAMGLQQVVVLGHSMGGAIAQQLAITPPAWLSGLILVGSAPQMPVSPAILEQIHTDFPAVADFITKYGWAKQTKSLLKGMGRKMLLEQDPDVVYHDFYACNQFDVRAEVAQIQLPTLIIGGQYDRMTPLKQSNYLHEQIKGSQLVIIEGAGHHLMLEKPREVAQVVETFVKGLLAQ
ncbi:MAG: alpha/beta hydrolase [Anaerolineales bacterium]|nr:alpha/beta hydrolase [Anaerolineales bacterium]